MKKTEEKDRKNKYYKFIGNESEERLLKPEDLNGIYSDFAEHLGIELTKLVFDNYKGLQVTFPVKFLSNDYISKLVLEEYNGNNVRDLARKFDCSERKIRNIIRESKLT